MAEYGDLTPRELLLILDEYNARLQREREDMLSQAYLTAAWQRAKRMPRYEEVMKSAKPKQNRSQTPQDIFNFVKHLQNDADEEGTDHGRS